MTSPRPRYSIVIPTHQGREVLVRALDALGALHVPWPIEVVVVVDGSTDGSAEAAAASPVRPRVVVQANAGAGAARNRGAREARGEILLFLDDDMLAEPALLEAHDARHRAGAAAVVGHIPLAPGTRDDLLTRGYADWATRRAERLQAGAPLRVEDLLTGQLSVDADVFAALGGFDESLTAGGRFGGEDTDFLHRLLRSGRTVAFAPDAVSHQQYDVTPGRLLHQWEEAGETDARLSRRHPELGSDLWAAHGGDSVTARIARSVGHLLPSVLLRTADRALSELVASGRTDAVTAWAYLKWRDLHYWRGVHRGGGYRGADHRLAVLAYHGIDVVDDPRTGRYAVPPEDFASQVRAMRSAGWRFVTGQEFVDHIDGRRPVRGRGVLLTFDDGYRSVLDNAAPVLTREGAVGVVLVVTGRVGGVNSWDVELGAVPQPLLDAGELLSLATRGWEVGVHSRTHARLPGLSAGRLREEVAGARTDLGDLLMRQPRFFAYPYGAHDARVRHAAAVAGYTVSLALVTGRSSVRRRARHAVPRIEVQAGMTSDDVLLHLEAPPIDPRGAFWHEARSVARWGRRVVKRLPGATSGTLQAAPTTRVRGLWRALRRSTPTRGMNATDEARGPTIA